MHGYLNRCDKQDAAVVEELGLISLRPGTDYKMSVKPSGKNAICVDGYLLLHLIMGKPLRFCDGKNRGVRCKVADF